MAMDMCGAWLEGIVIDHERDDDGGLCPFGPDHPEWDGWIEDLEASMSEDT